MSSGEKLASDFDAEAGGEDSDVIQLWHFAVLRILDHRGVERVVAVGVGEVGDVGSVTTAAAAAAAHEAADGGGDLPDASTVCSGGEQAEEQWEEQGTQHSQVTLLHWCPEDCLPGWSAHRPRKTD